MGVAAVFTQRPGTGIASLRRLRALVLLGGSVRPGRMMASIGRPVFELPLENGRTLLDAWRREAACAAGRLGLNSLPLRVMIDRAAPEPAGAIRAAAELSPATIERDPEDFRGTGGVLRDLSDEYADDDLLLVANAAQILLEPLAALVNELAETTADVSILSHEDGTASGLLLLRCAALRDLPRDGFIDIKEQALPAIAKSHRVAVVQRRQATALPVRTLAGYIEALQRYHQRLAGKPAATSPFEENWQSAFAIVEDGARVDPSARLHDAVVLRGGVVEADAAVVDGVVCPGAVLRRGKTLVDDLLAQHSNGRSRD